MFGTATPFGLLALVIGAGKRLTRVITALKNRRSAMGLADLDERQLKDIGLTRNDVFAGFANDADGIDRTDPWQFVNFLVA